VKGHRWFAAFYDRFSRLDDRRLGPLRRFAAGGAEGDVLEIGFGTGANLDFYDWSRVTVLRATEPDPFMLARARKRADLAPPDKLLLTDNPAEALEFAGSSFDTVVATLVLCTVEDPRRALSEVKRVLRPGGSLRLIEHVRGQGFTARFQDLAQPAWGWMAGGCVLGRPTEDYLRESGFTLDVESRTRFAPFMPAFAGVAYPMQVVRCEYR
jgi:ubiquinone/menaquinone biosynthesis C-methylase UbiE